MTNEKFDNFISIVILNHLHYTTCMEVIFMREINIASILVGKRKEKGITQDELAGYLGVSKAAISKWETGVSHS